MPPTRTKLTKSEKKNKAEEDKQDRGFDLRRGKACHVCRKKKLRCDGVRPTCGYCQRGGHRCQFDDPETWGRQRQLQYQVQELTAKLEATRHHSSILAQVLEEQKSLNNNSNPQPQPMATASHLGLILGNDLSVLAQTFDPSPPKDPPAQQDFTMDFGNPDFFTSPEGSSSSLSSSSSSLSFEMMTCSDLTLSSEGGSMADSAACSFRVKIPPPFLNLQLTAEAQSALLRAFLPHVSQCCLDLTTMELLSRFEGNTPFHDSFRDAMFATSCRFEIENTQLSRYEGRLRQRAQFALRPRAVLSRADIFDCTRAAIVLALYFNMEDCLKEASTYVAIAFGYFLELDQTKESCCICEIARECTPKERLAFQSAYIADRLIAAQLQSPGIFPEEISETFTTDYSSDLRLDNGGQICSVSSQTTTPPSTPPGVRRSPLDQFAIMELRVNRLIPPYANAKPVNKEEAAVFLLQAEALRSALPSIYAVPSRATGSNVDLTILSIHTQVFAVLSRLIRRCSPRAGHCLEAAGEVVALIHELCDQDFALLDPIIGLCWEWCSEAILGELALANLSCYPEQQNIWASKAQFVISAMEKLAVYIPVVSVNKANLVLQGRAWNIK